MLSSFSSPEITKNSYCPLGRSIIKTEFFVGRTKLISDFKKTTGITIGEFIIMYRLKIARDYLVSGSSVNSAAIKSGFNNTCHFIRTFRKHYNTKPHKYSVSAAVIHNKEY